LLKWKGHRFFFWIGDRREPPHVHVQKEGRLAKFWLQPVGLAKNDGFRAHELTAIEKIVRLHADDFLEKWNETFAR
jgi:hypothetical protein